MTIINYEIVVFHTHELLTRFLSVRVNKQSVIPDSRVSVATCHASEQCEVEYTQSFTAGGLRSDDPLLCTVLYDSEAQTAKIRDNTTFSLAENYGALRVK